MIVAILISLSILAYLVYTGYTEESDSRTERICNRLRDEFLSICDKTPVSVIPPGNGDGIFEVVIPSCYAQEQVHDFIDSANSFAKQNRISIRLRDVTGEPIYQCM
jgi:hypothetical protein